MTGDRSYRVMGSGGVSLAVFEHGDTGGLEILFIHGFCQSHLAWQSQLESPALAHCRMISLDLRGHGDSDKPATRADYDDDMIWADDVAAVIASAGLARPVIVAWSFGARVVLDYLRCRGRASVAGINAVGAALRFGAAPGAGPRLAGQLADDDLDVRTEATRAFLRSCFHRQPPDADFVAALAYNMAVPAAARRFILERRPSIAGIDVLANLPLLVSHGAADAIMQPDGPAETAGRLPLARMSLYQDVGHAVMAEAPGRFNAELADFVAAATSRHR